MWFEIEDRIDRDQMDVGGLGNKTPMHSKPRLLELSFTHAERGGSLSYHLSREHVSLVHIIYYPQISTQRLILPCVDYTTIVLSNRPTPNIYIEHP